MFHLAHSSKNNTEIQPKEKYLVGSQFKPSCDLSKNKKNVNLSEANSNNSNHFDLNNLKQNVNLLEANSNHLVT